MTSAIMLSHFVACLTLVCCGVHARPSDAFSDKEYLLDHLTELLDSYRDARDQQLLQRAFTINTGSTIQFDNKWPGNSVKQWPHNDLIVGQVGGVAVHNSGDLYVFHRGNRTWDQRTFDLKSNKFANPKEGPIKDSTIIRVNQHTGHVMEKFGDNKFYLPHGLSIDKEGNLWVTDVALHQVIKIPAGSHEPSLILGEALVPGDDDRHFCKPTDVAVASNGDFFVSDGYCNNRILKFDKDGNLLKKWGRKPRSRIDNYSLLIPHSLTLLEDADEICVADREHGRVVCYTAGLHGGETGKFVDYYMHPAFGTVYAVTNKDGRLYLVNGPGHDGLQRPITLFEVDIGTGDILSTAKPPYPGFGQPHDIDISPDGASIYTGEIYPWDRVLRFKRIQQ